MQTVMHILYSSFCRCRVKNRWILGRKVKSPSCSDQSDLNQSPFKGKSVHSVAIFAAPPGSSNKSYLNVWGNPKISKTAQWTQLNCIFQISNKIWNELPHECCFLVSCNSAFSYKVKMRIHSTSVNQSVQSFRKTAWDTVECEDTGFFLFFMEFT